MRHGNNVTRLTLPTRGHRWTWQLLVPVAWWLLLGLGSVSQHDMLGWPTTSHHYSSNKGEDKQNEKDPDYLCTLKYFTGYLILERYLCRLYGSNWCLSPTTFGTNDFKIVWYQSFMIYSSPPLVAHLMYCCPCFSPHNTSNYQLTSSSSSYAGSNLSNYCQAVTFYCSLHHNYIVSLFYWHTNIQCC